MWDTSCRDWRERIRAGRSLVPSLPLNEAAADRAVKVFDRLRLADVPGNPTLAEAAGPWFRDIVRALHGSMDPATRTRRIRELFLLVPKKNSKTTNGALLMLASLIVNTRPNGEFLLVGPTQKIADLAFDQAAGAIALDPYLQERMHVQSHLSRITYQPTGATLSIKSFDPKIVTGSKAAGILLDELLVVASGSEADRVIRQLRGGMVSQPDAFMAIITTQSERPPAGVFKAELERARAVRDGDRSDPFLLPILYEFPEDIGICEPGPDGLMPWEDPKVWHMVTPNAGRSITVERLIPDYQSAKASGLEALRGWASQHLNVEIGLALRADRWAGANWWERRGDRTLTLERIVAESDVLVAGIDGGGLDDLLSLSVIGRHRQTRAWLHWSHSWAHEVALERRKSEAGALRDFGREGDLTVVADMSEAFADLAMRCGALYASGLLAHIGLDPAGVGLIVEAIAAAGMPAEAPFLVGVSQGWPLQGAIKTAEVKVSTGELLHCGQRIMAWAVGNAKTEVRGNALTITKQASGTGKIDPLMSLFDAVALMTKNPSAATSYLETADLVVV
jgi:phage terminase large subunit-like protein